MEYENFYSGLNGTAAAKTTEENVN